MSRGLPGRARALCRTHKGLVYAACGTAVIGSRGRARPLSIADWSSGSGAGRGGGLEVDELALGGYGDVGVGPEAGREGV